MKSPFKILLSLIFPPRCASCKELMPYDSSSVFCDICGEKWKEEAAVRCHECTRPIARCSCIPEACRGLLDALVSVSPYTAAQSVTDRIVLMAKDHRDPELFEFMANKMTDAIGDRLRANEDLIVTFVPRSALRKHETGHDHAEILAKLIAENLEARFVRLFKKRGRIQQKSLGKNERLKNAKSSYLLLEKAKSAVDGKIVVLCDDVVTTGSSIAVCADLLRRSGARKVYALTFAKTLKKADKKDKNAAPKANA